MIHGMRLNGWALAAVGAAGFAFYWLTDPRLGMLHGTGPSVIDRANDSLIGTVVGLVVSGMVLLIGLWLGTRRRI